MRFITFRSADHMGLGIRDGAGYTGMLSDQAGYPGDLMSLLAQGHAALSAAAQTLQGGAPVDLGAVTLLPPLPNPGKLICVGLNYADHTAESGLKQPDYPTIFARFANSLVAHGAPIVRPNVSTQLDYEGEIAAIIGTGGRNISRADALSHVAGYALFNDASIRDYQFKSPQWTMGKTFDGTGPFGPELVTSDELPPGCKGLQLITRLNGQEVQRASTDDMIFDVQTLVVVLSEAITLAPGDVIVTGTPAGVGLGRKPPLWMKAGDVCEVEVERLGLLSNPVADESTVASALPHLVRSA